MELKWDIISSFCACCVTLILDADEPEFVALRTADLGSLRDEVFREVNHQYRVSMHEH